MDSHLRCPAAGGENAGIGTACQVEKEQVGLVFDVVVDTTHSALAVRRVDESLRIAQNETYEHSVRERVVIDHVIRLGGFSPEVDPGMKIGFGADVMEGC